MNKWGRRERWTMESWGGSASQCEGGTDPRPHANVTGTLIATVRTALGEEAVGLGRSMDDGGDNGGSGGAVTGADAPADRLVPPEMPPSPAC